MQVAPVKTPVFGKTEMKIVSFNVQPSVLLPGVIGRHRLIAIQEYLAGMILEPLQRVKFHPDQSACQDCEPGISFENNCRRISLWGGCGVNRLDHCSSEPFDALV